MTGDKLVHPLNGIRRGTLPAGSTRRTGHTGDEAARLRQEIAALRTELARPWWRRLIGR
jgi:hypothetical protein